LDGKQYRLATNNLPNALHGGKVGWDKRVWQGRRILHPEGQAVQLTYTSADGEEVRD
jgi:aldose 1-epimerase